VESCCGTPPRISLFSELPSKGQRVEKSVPEPLITLTMPRCSQARHWRNMVVEDEGRVRVNGAELYYEVGGEGQPLVLLHDGLLDRRVWDDQFVAFARLYRTIRYDRRGYGNSSAPDRPFSEVSDLHHLLRHLGINQAYLLGISNGAKVALEFALEHPGMVAALVLVGPNLGGYRPSEEKQRRVSEILFVALERGVEAGVEAWMEDPFYPPAKDKPAARERLRRIARENLPRLLSAPGLREEPDPPTMQSLSRIVAPTLILVGERDDRDNREIASILASRLPRAKKKVFAGCGHLVNLERPEEFYSVVAEFLDAQGYPSEPSPR
jgi:3-oxoadipate enol-lactonase